MTETHFPPCTVLIATGGDRPQLLDRTLASLAACRQPLSYRETVVIENGGDGGCEAIVQRHHAALRTRYLYQREGNKSAALNTALETIDRGLIVFADDDVRFDPGVLIAYAEATADCDRGVYFGGPVSVDYAGDPPPDWLVPYLPASAVGFELTDQATPLMKGHFLGFNWAAFVCDLKRLGGFNPERGPGAASGATGQEGDMQDRLLAADHEPRYVPEARVWHWVPPERCSVEWALHRRYRSTVNQGVQAARKGARGLPWIGPVGVMVPMLWREWSSRRARRGAPRAERRFLRRLTWQRIAGLRSGFRHARRRARGAAPNHQ